MLQHYLTTGSKGWFQYLQITLDNYKDVWMLPDINPDTITKALLDKGFKEITARMIPYYETNEILATHAPLDYSVCMMNGLDYYEEQYIDRVNNPNFHYFLEKLDHEILWQFTDENMKIPAFKKFRVCGHQPGHAKNPRIFRDYAFIDTGCEHVTTETFAKAYAEKYIVEGLMKSNDTSLFRRFEDKYIVPKALKNELVKALERNLKADYPDSKTKFNLMKSTYFDSSSLDMLQHHMSKANSRFKLRTREYAPNGKLQKTDYAFLEIKAKHGDITDKFRIKVPKGDMETFKKGAPLTPTIQLAKMNPGISLPDLVKRVGDINQALELFHLRPSCETQYVRRAYTDGTANDAGLRVTFDEGINYKVLDVIPRQISNDLQKGGEEGNNLRHMVDSYSSKDHMILEVKHHGSVPDWLTKFLNDNQLQKTNFSKYCYSIAKHATGK
ncbi:unnamed protein product [Sphagnum balticum]